MVRPSFPVVAAALALTVFVASCAVARPVVVAGPQALTSPIVRVSTLAAVASPIAAAPPEPGTSELATTDLATTALATTAVATTAVATTVATTTPASVPEATPAAPPTPAPPTLAPAAPTLVTDVAPWPVDFGPLKRGSSGDDVRALQQRLVDLGFWIDDIDGDYGLVTSQAVMAFQKFYGSFYVLDPSGNADAATIQVLRSITARPHGQSDDGDLIEVDKTRQVLFVVRGGATKWIFNTSTGSGKTYTEVNQKDGGEITGTAYTPEGRFKVYREYSDGWEKGQLGELYRPKYFKGGVAVHGLSSVPNYPASHGCVRVSLAAMDWIWANDIMPRNTVVWVHADEQ